MHILPPTAVSLAFSFILNPPQNSLDPRIYLVVGGFQYPNSLHKQLIIPDLRTLTRFFLTLSQPRFALLITNTMLIYRVLTFLQQRQHINCIFLLPFRFPIKLSRSRRQAFHE